MGYRSGWSQQLRDYVASQQTGTETYVQPVVQPYTFDTLGIKRWKTTGEKYIKGQEQTEGFSRLGQTWNMETASWEQNEDEIPEGYFRNVNGQIVPFDESNPQSPNYIDPNAKGKRPKRTYNEATGEWEVEKFYDSRDDQGRYWKDGIQVDSSGRPWQKTEDEMIEHYETNENTSTPGTGVGGGEVPEVGDQTIDIDDPKNITMGESSIDLITGEEKDTYGGKGYSQRTKGYNPFLKIKKQSEGKKGAFTRGSLRVRKPRRMAV